MKGSAFHLTNSNFVILSDARDAQMISLQNEKAVMNQKIRSISPRACFHSISALSREEKHFVSGRFHEF